MTHTHTRTPRTPLPHRTSHRFAAHTHRLLQPIEPLIFPTRATCFFSLSFLPFYYSTSFIILDTAHWPHRCCVNSKDSIHPSIIPLTHTHGTCTPVERVQELSLGSEHTSAPRANKQSVHTQRDTTVNKTVVYMHHHNTHSHTHTHIPVQQPLT